MARVFVTGSSDGLGLMSARLLVEQGHEVVLHARDDGRADDARRSLPGASAVVVGDLVTLAGMNQVADGANATGRFDAIVHNAAVGSNERRIVTADGLCHVFAVNVLAPYLLTARIEMPRRLVYMSSGMHRGGNPSLDDLQWERRRWSGPQAYSDSKLYISALAAAVAAHRPEVCSNAVDPGWVPTKMGGPGAPDDLGEGAVTQAWLAVSDDAGAKVSGSFFFHQRAVPAHPAMADRGLQVGLLAACAALSAVALFPAAQS